MTYDELLTLFGELIDREPDIQLKGAKNKYTSINGNMIGFLGDGPTLALRLSKAERAAFLEQWPDAVVISYNTVMKDYVGVPAEILADESRLLPLWEQMMVNARALKPKPTKKPKKPKKKA